DPVKFKTLSDALNKQENFSKFEVKDGKVTASTQTATVGELVGIKLPTDLPKKPEDLGAWGEAIKQIAKVGKENKLNLRDPGIATTIIGLGLDLALAEEVRARTEIAAVKSLLKVRNSLIADLGARKNTLTANLKSIHHMLKQRMIDWHEKIR